MRHAVIVDVDGTLLRSAEQDDKLYRRAVEQVIGAVRFRPDLRDYERVTDTGILLQILEDNAIDVSDALVKDVKAAFFAGIDEYIKEQGPFEALPGARQFIARLKGSPLNGLAIATGGWRTSAEMKLRTAEFDTVGVPFASSDDAIERVDIMRIALDSLGGDFDAVTYYGDGHWDREASRRLGWRFRAVGPTLDGIETFDHEFAD